jgi:DNA-binding CsgD family transcriptional regulator
MEKQKTMINPRVAVVDSNTLAVLGLRQILNNVIPFMMVETFGSFAELEANHPDSFFHYFVDTKIVLSNRQFFLDHRHKTIVLTTSSDPSTQLSDFHCLSINVAEEQLVRSLLKLEQGAHANGKNLPPIHKDSQPKLLSDREIEVMSLIVKGCINKEIADKLNIGMTTVITHRKNIMEKLGLKSVSALTIYAVMHGYVDINKI